jgi:hypothetical protein
MHPNLLAYVVCFGVGLSAIGCAIGEELERRNPDPDTGVGGTAGAPKGSGGTAGSATTGSGGSGGGGGSATGGSTGTGGSTTTGSTGGTSGKGGTGGVGGSGGGTGTGGSGPTSRVFFDDFEDGNATMPSWIDGDPAKGAMWSVVTRETSLVYAQSALVSDWVIAVSGDYRWTDQVVEATVKRTTPEGMIGIFGRVLDMRNYYFLYFDDANIILRKRVDNSSANLAKVKFPVMSNVPYALKLSIVGSTLTGYVDGMQLVTASDSLLTTGGIGVGTSDSATGEFDNVSVSR